MQEPQESLLDFVDDNQLAGFRLHSLQIYNWGTFNNQVKVLKLDGQNTLLTGDIGSGKSTLVDAVTTLLVPSHRIAYNKAAGAGNKERSLRSYVMGYFRATRSEIGASQQDALRDHNCYSVILGQFYNEGFDQWVTLAQVFWLKDGQNSPAKLFVVAEQPLTIEKDFADFGADIRSLRKRLQQQQYIEVFDAYNAYAGSFRRRFGIKNEQALELFHQTVSMKQVGNLTDFVRENMLEAGDNADALNDLTNHFEDLNRAHQLVLKAKRQIEMLQPIVKNGSNYNRLQKEISQWEQTREALTGYFTNQKITLLNKRQQLWQKELQILILQIENLNDLKTSLYSERDDLKQAIMNEGGDRLASLTKQITEAEKAKASCLAKQQSYHQLLKQLSLPSVETLNFFLATAEKIIQLSEQLQQQKTILDNQRTEQNYQLHEKKLKLSALEKDIASLKQRKNNIDSKQIQIRQLLCNSLNLPEKELPFIGELLQVRGSEQIWEGAIERILHNFALSLLVPDSLYNKVADWVENTHLKGRLVYYRVTESRHKTTDLTNSHPQSLVRKINIKPHSQFYPWLEAQLMHRFDYACCQDMQQFKREKFAVSLQGQIKAANNRHEKDDRRSLNDRRYFVLGWSNQDKIALLEKEGKQLSTEFIEQAEKVSVLEQQLNQLTSQLQTCARLEEYKDFSEMDWQDFAKQIDGWQQEKSELEASHNSLKILQTKLEQLEASITKTEAKLKNKNKDEGSYTNRLETCVIDIENSKQQLALEISSERYHEQLNHKLAELQQKWQIKTVNQVEHLPAKESELRAKITGKINSSRQKAQTLRDRVNGLIKDFRHDYPAETVELLIDIIGLDDYKSLLKNLLNDNLPRFERKFKEQLNQNIINQISQFKISLKQSQQNILERIDKINLSLADIDYNPNRYIKLELAKNNDVEIKQFYLDLESCVEGSFTNSDDAYAEAKFLQVKALIDRFKGRETLQDLDKKWTKKVTDVRNFYLFSASEKWRETDEEHEHYSDSSGKSGGQKEKLAYTVLAASLAYQFGMEFGEIKSRSFRFVVIDEAFGRGSDESARYGLELFKKLNLQLLVITPKQKIHVIEPYVSHVGFVSSPEGRESYLRTLSIDEHLTEKRKRQALKKMITE